MFPGSFAGGPTTYDATNTALNTGTIFRIRDIESQVVWKNKNAAEFYRFLRELKSGNPVGQMKAQWGETDKAPNFVIVKAACNSSATSIDVFDAYQCVAGDVLYNMRTGEIVRLDAIDDADTVSTAATAGYGRGHMGTTAAAMKIGDRLIKMGNQMGEEDSAASNRTVTPIEVWNYCQAVQKTWQITVFQENAVMLDGVGQMDELQMRAMWEMDEEMNAALWFSKRELDSSYAGGNLYSMNGFDQQVRTHAFDFSNIVIPTWEMLNEKFSMLFDANSTSGEKAFFCGQGAYSSFVNAARAGGLKEERYETLFGTEVTAINVDGGTVNLVKDYRTFKDVLAGSGRIVDMAHVEYCPHQGLDRVMIPNVQLSSQPTIKKNMAYACGTLKVKHEDCHAIVSGLSQAFNANR